MSKRRITKQAFSPEAMYHEIISGVATTTIPWVVVSSMHKTEPLVVHAEDVRQMMLEISPTSPHCVIDMNGFSSQGNTFWSEWEYATVLSQRATVMQNFVDNANYSAARKGTWKNDNQSFPGELLRPHKR